MRIYNIIVKYSSSAHIHVSICFTRGIVLVVVIVPHVVWVWKTLQNLLIYIQVNKTETIVNFYGDGWIQKLQSVSGVRATVEGVKRKIKVRSGRRIGEQKCLKHIV